MFEGIKRWWKGVMGMLGYTTLQTILGDNIALSESMIDAIGDWKKMLNGQADWLTDSIKSLRVEAGICREFADAVLVELETEIDNEILNKTYQKCIKKLNQKLQSGLALGSFVMRPLGADKAEYVPADRFIPISFSDDGKLIDVAFLTVKKAGKSSYFTKLERHYFTGGNLTIESKCYHSQDRESIGVPCSITEVPEWAEINPGPVVYPGMQHLDFGYYKNPLDNQVDESDCGVSIFDAAKEQIKKADIQGARLDWEYASGERAIHVDDRALKQAGGSVKMASTNKRLYRGLNLADGKDKELMREYSPAMRDESYRAGLENYYRNIEFITGLAYGDLSDVQYVDKTATEVKASKARKYNRVTAIQCNLEECLEDFVRALAFYNGLYTSGYEFSCKFHDSILTDEEAERQQDRQDVSMGVMSQLEYRMKWYNEDEATAMANLPEQIGEME